MDRKPHLMDMLKKVEEGNTIQCKCALCWHLSLVLVCSFMDLNFGGVLVTIIVSIELKTQPKTQSMVS